MEEHRAMLNCEHSEGDQLYCVCLFCGKLSLPDPSWLFVVAGLAMIAANLYWWITL